MAWQIMCFGQKAKPRQRQNKKASKHKNHCQSQEIEPGTFRTPAGCITSGPLSQLNISIEIMLFYYFSIMNRNINKQRPNLLALLFFNKVVFSVIF